MKIVRERRKRQPLKTVLLMVLFVISATNCDNEIDVGLPEIEPEATFTVDDARSWFDMNNVDIVMMKSNSGDALKSDVRAKQPQRVPFEADWSSAISTHKGHLEVVEANLLSTTILWYATKESKQKWKETNNPGYRGSLSRLVIIKNTKEDWVRSYIMTIIGETSYLESKKFNLASNTYLKKDSHFAGSILFHRLSGDYVNGWAMEKGKVTGKIIKNASNVSAKRSNEQVAFDMPDCAYYEVHQLWEVCDIVPDYGGDGDLETIDETCYIVEGDLVDIMSVCVLISEPPPYAGPGGNGSQDENTQRLRELLRNKPTKLLEDLCDQINQWIQVIDKIPSYQANLRLQNVEMTNWFNQDIDFQNIRDAAGTVVNLDYFPVRVNQFPIDPSTGLRYTAPGFLEHIRTNMNDFVDTSKTSFNPSTVTNADEAATWNSDNPETAIITLDIPYPAGDGSVMCIESNPDSWTFTTLELPWGFAQGQDGQHPVSGNRQFGYESHSDGSFTFYTRGVDRITDLMEAPIAEAWNLRHYVGPVFEAPDALWNSFKKGIYDYVQGNSGSANPLSESDNKISRPNWEKVRDVLLGDRPVSDLGCD